MKTIDLPISLRALRKFDFPRKLGICERLYGKNIARHGICWVETSAQVRWKLDLRNPTHRWMVYGDYEGSAFLKWARKRLQATSIVVDSGANIGQLALYFALCVPRGRVLAIEPSTESADWLQECLDINTGLPVEVLRIGLGDATQRLFIKNIGPSQVHGATNQISDSEGQSVEVFRLEDILSVKGISAIELWKLDVEGYEIQALHGAEALLRRQAIGAVYAELAFGNGARIVAYLASFGYECHFFDSRGRLYRPSELPLHTNGLFLPSVRA